MPELAELLKVLDETGHHPLGPSGASRWMQCPGSLAATLHIPDTSNPYAEEGTKAHALAEFYLNKEDVVLEDYPEEMVEHISAYVDYVGKYAKRLFVEQDIDLGHLIPGCRGTADVVYVNGDELGIIDLKYGMGKVEPTTPQLKIYLSGARKAFAGKGKTFKKFRVHIFQPRNGGGSSVEVTAEELNKFENEVYVAAQRCMEPNAALNPSEKGCEWCKAKSTCNALYEHSLELVGGDFEVLPGVDSLSDEQMRRILTYKGLIEKWLKGIESEVFKRLEHGEKFDGFKMVEGRSVRKWADNAEAVLTDILGEDAFEQKLKGITAVEKILGKKHFGELGITEKPVGKPTLVPEDDKRPALSKIADDFSVIETD